MRFHTEFVLREKNKCEKVEVDIQTFLQHTERQWKKREIIPIYFLFRLLFIYKLAEYLSYLSTCIVIEAEIPTAHSWKSITLYFCHYRLKKTSKQQQQTKNKTNKIKQKKVGKCIIVSTRKFPSLYSAYIIINLYQKNKTTKTTTKTHPAITDVPKKNVWIFSPVQNRKIIKIIVKWTYFYCFHHKTELFPVKLVSWNWVYLFFYLFKEYSRDIIIFQFFTIL